MSPPPTRSDSTGTTSWLARLEVARQWNFLGLLIVIGVLFVVYPSLHDSPAGPAAFLTVKVVIFLACCRLIFRGRGNVVTAIVLGGPMFVAGVADLVLPEPVRGPIVTVGHGFAVLFILFTVKMILQMIYSDQVVSLDGVFGGICGYVLLAIAFAHVYLVMEAVAPGSFRAAEGPAGRIWDPTRADFEVILFSLLNLTTMGSDVLSPASRTAQAFAAVEGVIGQFYVAIIVADLVGKRMSQVLAEQPRRTPV